MRFDIANSIYEDYKEDFENMNIDEETLKAVIDENLCGLEYKNGKMWNFHGVELYKIVDESDKTSSFKESKLSILCDSSRSHGTGFLYIDNESKNIKIYPGCTDFVEIYFSKNNINIIKQKTNVNNLCERYYNLYIENIDLLKNSIEVNIYTDAYDYIMERISKKNIKEGNLIEIINDEFINSNVVPDYSIKNEPVLVGNKCIYREEKVYIGNSKLVYNSERNGNMSIAEVYKIMCTELGNDNFQYENYSNEYKKNVKFLLK